MKRRRPSLSRRLKRLFWLGLAAFTGVCLALPTLERFAHSAKVQHAAIAFVALFGVLVVARVAYVVRRWSRLSQLAVSDDRADYVIDNADYRRGSPKEHAYRRAMQLTLLATFDNRCAKCGARDDGVDLDHFFLPKNEGGCFIMRHADGYLVNNAVPLCMGCNRSKSDRSYRKFFSSGELVALLEKNAAMTKILNKRPPLDRRGHPHPRLKIDRAA